MFGEELLAGTLVEDGTIEYDVLDVAVAQQDLLLGAAIDVEALGGAPDSRTSRC